MAKTLCGILAARSPFGEPALGQLQQEALVAARAGQRRDDRGGARTLIGCPIVMAGASEDVMVGHTQWGVTLDRSAPLWPRLVAGRDGFLTQGLRRPATWRVPARQSMASGHMARAGRRGQWVCAFAPKWSRARGDAR